MPTLKTDDGVSLYYEETGSGAPIVFVHEFAGDHRSWEPQVRHFSRRYRCITYAARGYLPSDVPKEVERYSQARARDDIRCVLDALGIQRAHIAGLSMGGFAALHFGMTYGYRALSLVVAGCGYGAHPAQHLAFQSYSQGLGQQMLEEGMSKVGPVYGEGPARVQFQNKDPRGFAEFLRLFCEHSSVGSANTQMGYQAQRPSLYALVDDMARIDVPTLIVAGDEDDTTLEPSLLMKRAIPTAGLVVLPNTGHVINLEEPALFNQLLESFFHQVESGRWRRRDPRSPVASVYGPGGKP